MGLTRDFENYDSEDSRETIASYLKKKDYGPLIDALKALRAKEPNSEKSDKRHHLHVVLSTIYRELTAAGKPSSKADLLVAVKTQFPELANSIPASKSGITEMWREAELERIPQSRGY